MMLRKINVPRIRRTLVLSIVIVSVSILSLHVTAQESPSQTASVKKHSALKPEESQPLSNTLTTTDDKQDPKLAVYQVHRLADKILNLRSVRAKAFEVARIAAILWKYDEPHARSLFEKALNLTISNGNDSEARALSTLHRRVIALVARNDAEWAKRLIDAATNRETQDQTSRNFSGTNIRTALGLLEEDSPVAVQFAERSLKGGVHPAYLDFLFALRKKDEAEANRLFLGALTQVSQQTSVNVLEFHSLGLYLFTAPDLIDSDHRSITLVDEILVPNITADRPGVPKAMVRAYLATAADVLWRMTSDAEQRKFSYALCYMLRPKSQNVAPDLTPKLDAVMAALTPEVPAGLTNDSAFRYMNLPPTSTDEKLTKAENQPTQEGRDIAFLEIALQAWRKGDFKTARIAQGRISNLEASQNLATIIDFGDGAWAIKQNGANLQRAEAIANRLPQGIERGVLLQAVAKNQGKGSNANLTEETVDRSIKAARSMSDGRRPYLLLTAAAQLASLKSPMVNSALVEAVKDFNSFEDPAFDNLDWAQSIQIGPMKARFPLDVANVEFGFNEAFHMIALADPEAAMARADELRNEKLRARGLVEVGRAFLEKIPAKLSAQQEQPIRVGEDGMRKSASKTVMPLYPEDALKQREQGVAVVELQYDDKGDVVNTVVLESPSKSIGDAVSRAIKQWKFVPSKRENGTSVSVRGKLTFYFEIDTQGKGSVKNPKQYR